jgi:hypothetical protein
VEVVIRAGREHALDLLIGIQTREHDDRDIRVGWATAQGVEHRIAVGLRHQQVEQDDQRNVLS